MNMISFLYVLLVLCYFYVLFSLFSWFDIAVLLMDDPYHDVILQTFTQVPTMTLYCKHSDRYLPCHTANLHTGTYHDVILQTFTQVPTMSY